MPLRFVKHSEIDFEKWDEAINSCYNENPYAYSSWLNMVSPKWCALINNDYSVLIPLPVKTKLRINYISQPLFTQQLGIFSLQPLEPEFVKSALLEIPKKYPKIHLQLNTENSSTKLELKSRPTYCLRLDENYDTIQSRFSTHHKRNIHKAIEAALNEEITIQKSTDADLFIKNFKQTVGLKDKSLKDKEYELMHQIISAANGEILFCSNTEGEVLSGLFYLTSKTKIVNLFNFITPLGKEKKAMYLLLNYWIKTNAKSGKELDFEGSTIKSIARFYAGFGGVSKNYQIFTKKGFWLT